MSLESALASAEPPAQPGSPWLTGSKRRADSPQGLTSNPGRSVSRACIALGLIVAVLCSSAVADHTISPHPKILWKVKAYPTPTDTASAISAVAAVEFSPDGEQVITAGWEGSIKFFHRSNGAVAQTIMAHTGAVHSLSLSKDGLLLASGGADRMLNLWRVPDGTLLRSISAHTTAVHSVAFSPDASLVISGGGRDNLLRIWSTADGTLVRSMEGSSWGPFEKDHGMVSVAFSPDGRYVAGSALEVWTVDGRAVRVGPGAGEADARTHVKFTPDSRRVFATHIYGVLGYVIEDGREIRPRSTVTSPPFAISPDGRSLISASPGNPDWTNSASFIWAVLTDRDWALEPNLGEIVSYQCADGDCSLTFSALALDPQMRMVAAAAVSGEVLLFELPIWISGVQRKGNQVNLEWQGGSGNYQLQKLTPPTTWQDVGGLLTSNALSLSIDSASALLRLRNTAP